MNIKIITGLSGAGKSTVIKSLEDLGYYSIDNLPPALLKQFINMCEKSTEPISKIAIGIDVRGRGFFDGLEGHIKDLQDHYDQCEILFLDASDKTLIKRFKETRRTHPLMPEGTLIDGINLERDKLRVLKQLAQSTIDTSTLTGRELFSLIKARESGGDLDKEIAVTFTSFGFKQGLPLDSDLVFDVRFLPNPYYDEDLRPLTGNDQAIVDYVFQWKETQVFYEKLKDMLNFLLPQYVREGKNQVIVAIGCTGGRHRSVSIANRLAQDFKADHYKASVHHRDTK